MKVAVDFELSPEERLALEQLISPSKPVLLTQDAAQEWAHSVVGRELALLVKKSRQARGVVGRPSGSRSRSP